MKEEERLISEEEPSEAPFNHQNSLTSTDESQSEKVKVKI